jgi:hypothetical protein
LGSVSLLAALAMPVQLSAQEQSTTQGPDRYILTDLGPVGPVLGQAYFITNNDLISGAAAASDGSMQPPRIMVAYVFSPHRLEAHA